MITLPDHREADVDSLSDLGLFNLPRAAGRALMSIAVNIIPLEITSLIEYFFNYYIVYMIVRFILKSWGRGHLLEYGFLN